MTKGGKRAPSNAIGGRMRATGLRASMALPPPWAAAKLVVLAVFERTAYGSRNERKPVPRKIYPSVLFGGIELLTLGIFDSRSRPSFQACWTTQESERSCLIASSWISRSVSCVKYSDCFLLSLIWDIHLM